jgi:hypothetical protein
MCHKFSSIGVIALIIGVSLFVTLGYSADVTTVNPNIPSMRAIFFIDDWMLDSRRDVGRIFPHPKRVKLDFDDANDLSRGLSTIIYDPDKKKFLAWSKLVNKKMARLYESEDGVKWTYTEHTRELYRKQNFFEQTWFYDPWDSDPNQRHKMITYPYEKNTYGGPGLVETSPDGINWKLQSEWAWTPPEGTGSDALNNMFYNPFLQEYAIICRKYHIDRRIAMVTSSDLKNWSNPVMLMMPDPRDPPLMQFYGMKVHLYRNEIFLGFPQIYRVPNKEQKHSNRFYYKTSGKIHSELAYSYDGYAWNRTTRQPIIPPIAPGQYGGGRHYVTSMVQRPSDGRILIYSRGALRLHDKDRDKKGDMRPLPEKYKGGNSLLLHTWRADGFACLEALSNTSVIRTRYLVPKSPELSLNIQIPFGVARVQVIDQYNRPVHGFTFDDCVPLRGDNIQMPVHWNDNKDLTALINGKRIALEIKLSSGRLYAINLNCAPWYTNTRKPIPRP